MVTLTEGMHEGEFIGEHAMGIGYHVKEVTLLSGENLAAGTVVGQITTGGKYIASDANASDGSEDPAGILYAAVDASAGDVTNARIIFRGPIVVNGNDLTWDAGNDAADILAGKAALDLLGILVA